VSGAGRQLAVVPSAGVPASASAVALNVTVTGSRAPGYLTVHPSGAARPTASSLNYTAGETVPNLVTTKVGTGGRISLFASGGCPDVVVDVAGYYTGGSAGPGGFVGIVPNRVVDTRTTGTWVRGAGREVVVAPSTDVPAGASSVVLNVTVVGAGAPGYLSVGPTEPQRPTASSLNYVTRQTVANQVTTKVGAGGRITLFASGGCPHVVVDVAGYHRGGPPGPGGFEAISPRRVSDTRVSGSCVSGPNGRSVVLAPSNGVPSTASAVVLNVTAVRPVAPGYLTVAPTGSSRPNASNVNFLAGQVVPNAVIAKVGTGGRITLFASGGCPDVVVDVAGYHAGT
jgi:hypothetical protein